MKKKKYRFSSGRRSNSRPIDLINTHNPTGRIPDGIDIAVERVIRVLDPMHDAKGRHQNRVVRRSRIQLARDFWRWAGKVGVVEHLRQGSTGRIRLESLERIWRVGFRGWGAQARVGGVAAEVVDGGGGVDDVDAWGDPGENRCQRESRQGPLLCLFCHGQLTSLLVEGPRSADPSRSRDRLYLGGPEANRIRRRTAAKSGSCESVRGFSDSQGDLPGRKQYIQ